MCRIFEWALPKLLLYIFEEKSGLEILAIAKNLNFLFRNDAVEILVHDASLFVFISQVFHI